MRLTLHALRNDTITLLVIGYDIPRYTDNINQILRI
ncbi:hypothetical protein VTL71DRAFT_10774 [Oculimacula yallundae]|uniref:Uncharacterized protein n=1 Tax=Oculimacula yallundae TaxID=86028 RepID=A0ABR4CUC3_9HELO